MFGIIKRLLRRKEKTMKIDSDEPLYGNDKCSACGGEVVKVIGGATTIFACIECGKRA